MSSRLLLAVPWTPEFRDAPEFRWLQRWVRAQAERVWDEVELVEERAAALRRGTRWEIACEGGSLGAPPETPGGQLFREDLDLFLDRIETAAARYCSPERIEHEWWSGPLDDPRERSGRDYFKIQDDRGAWLWVYRRRKDNRWFCHGEWC